ncbi:MAG: SRPBCC domain-containing protein [Vicinamibacterales bacterium]|mgnify:CR=1 FL=1
MSEKSASTFNLRYAVQAAIRATPSAVWTRLTDANGFPAWNSTVTSIEGDIALGSRLAIRVPLAPGRVFRPRVVELVPERRMVWRDGFAPMFQGTRTFTLTPRGESTDFEMVEVFEGLMLPLIKRSLPDFGPVFDRYAADLRQACERG